ncbi:MAG TPA: Ig-like domain-containing protein, partial [Gammaproteobacteria bacterium]|nr:Ig-like domain-containing protein [Gammaproteobacteria bacterium]
MDHPKKTASRDILRRSPVALAVAAVLAGSSPSVLANPAPGAAVDSEFKVNNDAATIHSAPGVAMDAAGDFVVTWTGAQTITAQRYAADGTPKGSEFQVNTQTTYVGVPRIAMDAAGDFVITWMAYDAENDGNIHARRFSADGMALSDEFQVDTANPVQAYIADVAMDAAGDFIVTWARYSKSQDLRYGVYAQRYASDGSVLGGEFEIDTDGGASEEDPPCIAMDTKGDFVVGWTNYEKAGVFARAYSSDGTAKGAEFTVQPGLGVGGQQCNIAMDAAGDFVMAWENTVSTLGSNGQIETAFYKGGVPQGTILTNTTTGGFHQDPDVKMDVAGDFVVTWDAQQTGSNSIDIYARRFASTGLPVAQEFRVNTTTANAQVFPAIALDAAGDSVIVWQGAANAQQTVTDVYTQQIARSSSLDLAATLTLSPSAAMVAPGTGLSLTADVANNAVASEPTGVSLIDDALTDATGVVATITLPPALLYDSASGSGWNCTGPVSLVLTCNLTGVLAAGETAPAITIDVSTSSLPAALSFSNAVSGDQPDTTNTNDTAHASVIADHTPGVDDGSLTLDENTSSGGTLTGTDQDGDTLTFSKSAAPQHGVLTVNANGSYTYTPTTNYHGTDSFTFKANDGVVNSAAGTVPITVNHVNQAPVANNATVSMHAEGTATGTVTATDVDGDTLTYSTVTGPAHGTGGVNANGSYSYTPDTGYRGSDSFRFKVNDGTLDSNTATLSLTILDNAPVASAKSLAVDHNTVKSGTAKSSDTDADSVTYAKVALPKHGTLFFTKTGSFTYTPAVNYSGADHFTFTASDGSLVSAPATVSITVTEHTPVADKAAFTMTHNTTHSGRLQSTDADAGDPKNFRKVTGPSHGTLTLSLNGSYVYKPK